MKVGILFRRETNLTYARIQDIHLRSGILQRWLRLANVQIQTASGSAGPELVIEGFKEYEFIRDFLYTRMRGYQARHGSPRPAAEVCSLLLPPAQARIFHPAAASSSAAEARWFRSCWASAMSFGARESCSKPTALPCVRRDPVRLNSNRPPVYSAFRQACERLLRIPHDPAPPPGDEASTRIFRAAPNYYRYLFLIWALKTAFAIFIVVVALVVPLAAASFAMVKQGQGWGALLVLLPLLVLLLDVLV